jgi:hypothetical protein
MLLLRRPPLLGVWHVNHESEVRAAERASAHRLRDTHSSRDSTSSRNTRSRRDKRRTAICVIPAGRRQPLSGKPNPHRHGEALRKVTPDRPARHP